MFIDRRACQQYNARGLQRTIEEVLDMISAISGSHVGNLTWRAITGQSVVNVDPPKPQDLMTAAKTKPRSDLDQSHMPDDEADMTDADRLVLEEQKAHKHIKSFLSLATNNENLVRMLGGLGSFWGLIEGLLGSPLSGWIAAAAGAGSAITVLDSSFQVKSAAVNRNLPAAIDGTFSMIHGTGVLLSASGLGRIPALVAAGALVGKLAYGMYRSTKDEKEKEALKKADKERKDAEKAARQAGSQGQPSNQPVPPDPTAASTPPPADPQPSAAAPAPSQPASPTKQLATQP